MADHVPSNVLEGVADLIESYGCNSADIARRVGVSPKALYSSDVLINEIKVNDLFEEAALRCNDRFFGVKLAKVRGFDTLGALWLLARNARTVGEKLTIISENMALHVQAMSCYIARDKSSGKSLVFEFGRPSSGAPQADTEEGTPLNSSVVQVTELSLALCCKELRRSLGAQWNPVYVQFQHAAPDTTDPLRRVFGEHVFFNQDVNAIHISNDDFDRPNYRNPNNTISSAGQKVIQREMEASIGQSLSFVQRTSRIIRLLINDQGCTVTDVAQALNLPVRTLQYRLKQNQISYQKLYDSVRFDLAKHYLSQSELSIGSIAERLHFTDAAAFSHFFKRRQGATPRQFRCE